MVTGFPIAYKIVGESHYREHLYSLINAADQASRDEGVVDEIATLQLEPDNPYDANAIKVIIGGGIVGHIAKEQTYLVRPLVEKANSEGRALGVFAQLGWDAANNSPYIGVTLGLPTDLRDLADITLT